MRASVSGELICLIVPPVWSKLDRLVVGHGRELFEDVREVGLVLNVVVFARFDQRVDHRTAEAGVGMADK